MPVTPLMVALTEEALVPGSFTIGHGFPSGTKSRYRCRICWTLQPNSKGCDDWQDRALDGVCDECWGEFCDGEVVIETRRADGTGVVETETAMLELPVAC
jgi:hypothetical protein